MCKARCPSWSKGPDSSSGVETRVGSNPTLANFLRLPPRCWSPFLILTFGSQRLPVSDCPWQQGLLAKEGTGTFQGEIPGDTS